MSQHSDEGRAEISNHARRAWVGRALGLVCAVSVQPTRATPASLEQAVFQYANGQPIRRGRVELTLPEIVENGNSVPVTVYVPSPMTEHDHVRRIAIFSEKNPSPEVLQAELSPQSGRAQVSFRMRMADSQTIMALAQMSDDSYWSASIDVVVALAACLE